MLIANANMIMILCTSIYFMLCYTGYYIFTVLRKSFDQFPNAYNEIKQNIEAVFNVIIRYVEHSVAFSIYSFPIFSLLFYVARFYCLPLEGNTARDSKIPPS